MRRKWFGLCLSGLVAMSAGCSGGGETEAALKLPVGAEVLGEELTVTEAPVPLSAVRANPDAYFEKTLLVEATAQDVCQRAGCWMTITDGDGEPIWVRWSTGCGGKYAFPKDASGRRLLVQGSFYAKEIAPEDAAHIAEESGTMDAGEIAGKTFEMNATACVLLPVTAS